MKFWKFQYLGESVLEQCVQGQAVPLADTSPSGLANTDRETMARMRPGDGVIIAELLGDQAKIYALGKVRSVARSEPTVVWARNTNYRQPDERGGLIHWQTKTAFEISPEPAKRYGLKELVEHYVKDDA